MPTKACAIAAAPLGLEPLAGPLERGRQIEAGKPTESCSGEARIQGEQVRLGWLGLRRPLPGSFAEPGENLACYLGDRPRAVASRPEVESVRYADALDGMFQVLDVAGDRLKDELPWPDRARVADHKKLTSHHRTEQVRQESIRGDVATPDDVSGACRDDARWHAASVGVPPGGHEQLTGSLARAVWIVATERIRLDERPPGLVVGIDLVAGRHQDLRNRRGPASRVQDMGRAEDVRLECADRISHASTNERLRGEVEHRLRLGLLEHLFDRSTVSNVVQVGFNKVRNACELVGPARFGIEGQAAHLRSELAEQDCKPRALEASMARDQHPAARPDRRIERHQRKCRVESNEPLVTSGRRLSLRSGSGKTGIISVGAWQPGVCRPTFAARQYCDRVTEQTALGAREASGSGAGRSRDEWWRRLVGAPWLWCVALIAAYVALSFVLDAGGGLGVDSGSKVGTLRIMGERDSFKPDIGYWAEQWDPDADYHGMLFTSRIGDQYVNVTSLPMIVLAHPLWGLGGHRAVLLPVMVGAVAAALAARALAERLAGDDRDRAGALAFWIVGLASPVTVYALDVWEHTIGLAAMAWGVVLLLDAISGDAVVRSSAVAGALFGFAYSMRTEALLYFVTTVGLCLLYAGHFRVIGRCVRIGVAAVGGFGALFVGYSLLEILVLGQTLRAGRTGLAASQSGRDLTLRIREGLATIVGEAPSTDWVYLGRGTILAFAIGVFAWAASRSRRSAALVGGAAVVILFILFLRAWAGLGFWPGVLATTPFAAAGLALAWSDPARRHVALIALVPIPAVVWFQFPGGAVPQWGGRYLLLTGLLLEVIGIAAAVGLPRDARLVLVAVAVFVTGTGVAWLSQRSHEIAIAGDALNARPEQVLIAPEGFLPREFGSTWGAKDWLVTRGTSNPADLPAAVDIVKRSGRESFAIVLQDSEKPLPSFPGFRELGRSESPFLSGTRLTVVSYARD